MMAVVRDLKERAAALSDSLSTNESCDELKNFVPASVSVTDLLQLAETVRPDENPRPTLLAITACLRDTDRLPNDIARSTTACELATWAARSIAPVNQTRRRKEEDGGFLPGYGGATDEDPYDRVAKRCLVTGEIALTALKLLWERSDKEQRDILDNDGLVTLMALADPSEAWATPTTTALASQLLSEQLATLDVTDFLIQSILKGYLQKLFSKSRPTTVTASGRKAEYQDDDLDRQQGLPDDSRQTKPWKYEDLRSIPVLAWAVEQADESLIWPLYIPPLITLLDDPLTRIRARGLRLAASFLSKFPATKLRMTGLASVFEEAIFPTLNYLPSLTPERESILLLDPAFDALLVLARKLADPAAAADGKEGEEGSRRESRKLLDRILRGGVFAAFFHAGQHVAIVEVLMRKTSAVVAELGVHAVKHLKDLVPMFYGVLTEPFAFSHAVALRAAVGALQVTVENCWPRLVEGVWQEEMVRMLVVCWVHSLDLDDVRQGGKLQDQDREDVRKELRKTALMLCAVAKTSGVDLAEKVATLITKEPAIAGLFAVSG